MLYAFAFLGGVVVTLAVGLVVLANGLQVWHR